MDRPDISTKLVQTLINDQFPQYSSLTIQPVELSGHDNRSFRLGPDLLVRLPSAKGYAAQVEKEQVWLKRLANHLSTPIPEPLHHGKADDHFPFDWSIYKWLPGQSLNQEPLTEQLQHSLALDLAQFLKELQQAPTAGAPLGGLHNYYRGCPLTAYEQDARRDIEQLKSLIPADKATMILNQALSSQWAKDPVWVHGDMAPGNILVQNQKLSAVIDFGCMAIGDPACDLVIAWTYFGAEKSTFEKAVGLDDNTWARARGWALWKANFELVAINDKSSAPALEKRSLIERLLLD